MSLLSRRHGWRTAVDDVRVCTCTPENPRHRSGYHCVTPAQIAAWRAAEPMAALHPADDQAAKLHTWMWLGWSQNPVAKQLSGRDT